MLINIVSLAIDVTDVVRYALGDRAEMVQGSKFKVGPRRTWTLNLKP